MCEKADLFTGTPNELPLYSQATNPLRIECCRSPFSEETHSKHYLMFSSIQQVYTKVLLQLSSFLKKINLNFPPPFGFNWRLLLGELIIIRGFQPSFLEAIRHVRPNPAWLAIKKIHIIFADPVCFFTTTVYHKVKKKKKKSISALYCTCNQPITTWATPLPAPPDGSQRMSSRQPSFPVRLQFSFHYNE